MLIQCHRLSGIITRFSLQARFCSTKLDSPEISKPPGPPCVSLFGRSFDSDEWTNVNPKILQLAERKLHLQKSNDFLFKDFYCGRIDIKKFPHSRSSSWFDKSTNHQLHVRVVQKH